jgi:hypothetical protein
MNLWSNMALTVMGNKLTRMMDIYDKTCSLYRTSMAKIWVEMNLCDGLLEGINIQVRNMSYHQRIYYVKILSRCSICHLYGHLSITFPKNDFLNDEDIVEVQVVLEEQANL